MASESAAMTEEEATALDDLRGIWQGAYHIAFIDGIWRAKRFNDVTVVITADSAEELKVTIQDDHAAWMSPARA